MPPEEPEQTASTNMSVNHDNRNVYLQGTLIIRGGRIAGFNVRCLGGLDDASLVMMEKIFNVDPDNAALKVGVDSLASTDSAAFVEQRIQSE